MILISFIYSFILSRAIYSPSACMHPTVLPVPRRFGYEYKYRCTPCTNLLETQREQSDSTRKGLRSGLQLSSRTNHCATKGYFFFFLCNSATRLPTPTAESHLLPLHHGALEPDSLSSINGRRSYAAAPAPVKCPSPPALPLSLSCSLSATLSPPPTPPPLSLYHGWLCERSARLTCLLTLCLCSKAGRGDRGCGLPTPV